MIPQEQLAALDGRTVWSADGVDVGTVAYVLVDDTTGRPEWVRVRGNSAGFGDAFVPLQDAVVSGGRLQVPFAATKIKQAPGVGGETLSVAEERELFRHFGLDGAREPVNASAGAGWAEMDRVQDIRAGTEGRETTRGRLRVFSRRTA